MTPDSEISPVPDFPSSSSLGSAEPFFYLVAGADAFLAFFRGAADDAAFLFCPTDWVPVAAEAFWGLPSAAF